MQELCTSFAGVAETILLWTQKGGIAEIELNVISKSPCYKLKKWKFNAVNIISRSMLGEEIEIVGFLSYVRCLVLCYVSMPVHIYPLMLYYTFINHSLITFLWSVRADVKSLNRIQFHSQNSKIINNPYECQVSTDSRAYHYVENPVHICPKEFQRFTLHSDTSQM